MMIDMETKDFKRRAVRSIKLLRRDGQRQTIIAIRQNRKAATTEDIARLRVRRDINPRVLYEFV